jgi:hypothetical protein
MTTIPGAVASASFRRGAPESWPPARSTTDFCDANGGGVCVNIFNTLPCNDGFACTLNDVCSLGQCSGQPKSCSDGNAWWAYAQARLLLTTRLTLAAPLTRATRQRASAVTRR